MRYRVEINCPDATDRYPVEVFGPEDRLPGETRPWSPERAWDCYKAKHPHARRLVCPHTPVVTPIAEEG